jgi:hypothetical protein
MCDACSTYALAGFTSCNICGMPCKARPSKPKRGKRGKQVSATVSRDIKPLAVETAVNRLHACGLTDDSKIAAGLANGAVANALYGKDSGDSEQVFLRYVLLVERVAAVYPEVARYRNRLISGIAA